MKHRAIHAKRTIVIILLFVLCVGALTGCAATGAKSPEELVRRLVKAAFSMNGEDLMDCILPSLSNVYRATLQFSASLTGQDPEKALAQEMYQTFASNYGLESLNPSELKAEVFIISKEERSATATVRSLLVININGKYDYEESYIVTSNIDGRWYFSSALGFRPEGYTPTKVMIDDQSLNEIMAKFDDNRLNRVFNSYMPVDPMDQLTLFNGAIIDSADLQATWDALDAYLNDPNSAERIIMQSYLRDEEYPPYYFELFIQEYQSFNLDSLLLRASVATTEAVNGFKEALAQTYSALMSDQEITEGLDALNVKDENVARLIVDYLASLDLSEEAKKIEMAQTYLTIAKDGGTLLKDVVSAVEDGDAYLVDTLLEKVGGLRFVYELDPRTTKVFRLDEILDLDTDNVRRVAQKLISLTDPESGLVTISVASDLGANTKLSFLDEFARINGAPSENLFSVMRRDIDSYEDDRAFNNVLVGLKGLLWCVNSALRSADAYEQLLVEQAVFNQQYAYLTKLLQYSDCEGAERIAQRVINLLTKAVAKNTVQTVTDTFLANMAAAVTSEITDEMAEQLIAKALGGSAGGIFTFFDVGTDIAMILANAEETKLQVWAVEDLYDEYLNARKGIATAMNRFYLVPTAENFESLYYSMEFYALMVNSGSSKVSNILLADYDSARSQIAAWFSESSRMERLEGIQDAKEIPGKDLNSLNRFRRQLFPTLQF